VSRDQRREGARIPASEKARVFLHDVDADPGRLVFNEYGRQVRTAHYFAAASTPQARV